ncbi:MAG: energy transducer TonB [Proteobacteria bacterium]|nr:energy transducer TonB [Pseudomonadota bacterium]
MPVIALLSRMTLLLALVTAAVADELGTGRSAPAENSDDARYEGQQLPREAARTCVEVGLPADSAEHWTCTRELVRALLTDSHRTAAESGVTPVRVLRGVNLGDRCAPYYLDESRRAREQGSVELIVYVGADGRAKKTVVRRSSGSPRLDRAAARCIRAEGVFEPQLRNGQPNGSWQSMKWTWRLD